MKIIDFGLSKPVKNVPKRHLKSKSKKTCDFVRFFYIFHICFKRLPLKLSPWPVFCDLFSKLAFEASVSFWLQKPSKNLSKTILKSWKNRCKNHVVFRCRFFRVLVGFGRLWGFKIPPKWAQNDINTAVRTTFGVLKYVLFFDRAFGDLKVRFETIWWPLWVIFWRFGGICDDFLEVFDAHGLQSHGTNFATIGTKH